VKRRGAGTHGDGIGGVMLLGESYLESTNAIAHRDPTTIDNLGQSGLLFLTDDRLRN
jgi:hypothetical protein